jgi:hypothetical protein
MVKNDCGSIGEYTHEDHFCRTCAYENVKETDEPCKRCFATDKCFWIPKLDE